jgi:uncharacterized membrane protein
VHSNEIIAGLNAEKSGIHRLSKVPVPIVAITLFGWNLLLVTDDWSVSLISVLLTASVFNLIFTVSVLT